MAKRRKSALQKRTKRVKKTTRRAELRPTVSFAEAIFQAQSKAAIRQKRSESSKKGWEKRKAADAAVKENFEKKYSIYRPVEKIPKSLNKYEREQLQKAKKRHKKRNTVLIKQLQRESKNLTREQIKEAVREMMAEMMQEIRDEYDIEVDELEFVDITQYRKRE